MTEQQFKWGVIVSASVFLAVFVAYTLPAALALNDPIAAFAAGFVNPMAAGYSTDVIMCWCIMLCWVIYERKTLNIKYGYSCCALGVVPGVAVGFAVYLLLRHQQLKQRTDEP